jgi:hypothetical protein
MEANCSYKEILMIYVNNTFVKVLAWGEIDTLRYPEDSPDQTIVV